MKIIKMVAILLLVYVGVVVTFESLLGYFQPANQGTLKITTQATDGTRSQRVLAQLETDGQLYIAANHWPRAWYREALANPRVEIENAAGQGIYIAVPLEGAEHDRINEANALGLGFRILTGFPPRYLLRLDPVQ
ncbi:DUF385 domain-containing protein [Halieaceae bacterium IMCC14734]|uniref:DUF385 domain-containing protein n=1 Tax=Candidatus Litorirhabdus singularis TaxID=2518993 RepID=A0ABT3TMS2_9GAMM|nr:nitroreductase/quinone reductase family protein [Candidatus Litorirhabdus singularis]MCX2982622.1 DUF385 domain-containing protein [Candidatus Litorirhabdus singularis]